MSRTTRQSSLRASTPGDHTSAATPAKDSRYTSDLEEEEIGEADCIEFVETPDGRKIQYQYRGVPPNLDSGSREYKKQKRLADNRASAARSRALHRAEHEWLKREIERLGAEYNTILENIKIMQTEWSKLKHALPKGVRDYRAVPAWKNLGNLFASSVLLSGSRPTAVDPVDIASGAGSSSTPPSSSKYSASGSGGSQNGYANTYPQTHSSDIYGMGPSSAGVSGMHTHPGIGSHHQHQQHPSHHHHGAHGYGGMNNTNNYMAMGFASTDDAMYHVMPAEIADLESGYDGSNAGSAAVAGGSSMGGEMDGPRSSATASYSAATMTPSSGGNFMSPMHHDSATTAADGMSSARGTKRGRESMIPQQAQQQMHSLPPGGMYYGAPAYHSESSYPPAPYGSIIGADDRASAHAAAAAAGANGVGARDHRDGGGMKALTAAVEVLTGGQGGGVSHSGAAANDSTTTSSTMSTSSTGSTGSTSASAGVPYVYSNLVPFPEGPASRSHSLAIPMLPGMTQMQHGVMQQQVDEVTSPQGYTGRKVRRIDQDSTAAETNAAASTSTASNTVVASTQPVGTGIDSLPKESPKVNERLASEIDLSANPRHFNPAPAAALQPAMGTTFPLPPPQHLLYRNFSMAEAVEPGFFPLQQQNGGHPAAGMMDASYLTLPSAPPQPIGRTSAGPEGERKRSSPRNPADGIPITTGAQDMGHIVSTYATVPPISMTTTTSYGPMPMAIPQLDRTRSVDGAQLGAPMAASCRPIAAMASSSADSTATNAGAAGYNGEHSGLAGLLVDPLPL